jgi:hypothetical protein
MNIVITTDRSGGYGYAICNRWGVIAHDFGFAKEEVPRFVNAKIPVFNFIDD